MIEEKKVIGVRFYQDDNAGLSPKMYSYFTSEDFSVGDHCVVNVSGAAKVVMVVAKESEMSARQKHLATKWIIGKVSEASLESNEKETEAAHIMDDMVQEADRYMTLCKLTLLAEDNKKLRKMLKRYNKLTQSRK